MVDAVVVPQQATLRPEGWPFILLAAAFSLYSFILSGVTSNLLALLERGGLSAATAVTIGAMFGPAQVASRLADFMLAGRTHPLWIARGAVVLVVSAFAMLAFAGISFPLAALFAIGFGAANGVMTIARGALPLLMFGPVGVWPRDRPYRAAGFVRAGLCTVRGGIRGRDTVGPHWYCCLGPW